jgi:hypothetical protein
MIEIYENPSGFEIFFNGVPEENVLKKLRDSNFKYSRGKRMWYVGKNYVTNQEKSLLKSLNVTIIQKEKPTPKKRKQRTVKKTTRKRVIKTATERRNKKSVVKYYATWGRKRTPRVQRNIKELMENGFESYPELKKVWKVIGDWTASQARKRISFHSEMDEISGVELIYMKKR